MRAILSLFKTGRDIPETDRIFWELSAHLARKFHGPTKLYADPESARTLIDKWGITFDELDVTTIPKDTRGCHPMCWSAGKLAAMRAEAAQGKPFFHIDGDAFLLSPLREDLRSSRMFCQCIEKQLKRRRNVYRKNSHYPLNELLPDLKMPRFMQKYFSLPLQRVMNMGIFGGTDCASIHEYADIAIKVFVQNRYNTQAFTRFHRSRPHFLGIAAISEQWSASAYCHWKGIIPTQLMNRIDAFNLNRMHEVQFGHIYSAVRKLRNYQHWASRKLESLLAQPQLAAA